MERNAHDFSSFQQPLREPRFMLSSLLLCAAIVVLPVTAVDAIFTSGHSAMTATGNEVSPQSPHPDAQWGIEVIGVRSTAAGYMLEFRYRVTDAKKAAALFERKTKPYLSHHESGKVLGVASTAKLGPLRNSNTPQQGRNYWMFFGNAGRLVQAGDKVTVDIGDYKSDVITVE